MSMVSHADAEVRHLLTHVSPEVLAYDVHM
jgi:hypothetical protein